MVPSMTFDLRQRPDIFDVRQSWFKTNVNIAPIPLISLSKIVVQLCYTLMRIKGDQIQISVQCNSRVRKMFVIAGVYFKDNTRQVGLKNPSTNQKARNIDHSNFDKCSLDARLLIF